MLLATRTGGDGGAVLVISGSFGWYNQGLLIVRSRNDHGLSVIAVFRQAACVGAQTKTIETGAYRIVLVALLWTLATGIEIAPACSQTNPAQYVATIWQTEQGLPQNSVSAIAQDRDGYTG